MTEKKVFKNCRKCSKVQHWQMDETTGQVYFDCTQQGDYSIWIYPDMIFTCLDFAEIEDEPKV